MTRRFENNSLDAMLRLVKDEYDPDLPPSEQSPQFYDMVDRYNRARHWYKLYGAPVPFHGGVDRD